MPERNVDKIKRLEHEHERLMRKIKAQHGEISRLNQAAQALRDGLRELSRATDAIMAGVAVKFGAEVGAGAFEAVLPTVKVDELLRQYKMAVTSSDGQYIIRAVRREGGEADGD